MQASDWIKCSERMPETYDGISERVLFVSYRHNLYLGQYREDNMIIDSFHGPKWDSGFAIYSLDEITHWMPIVGPEEE